MTARARTTRPRARRATKRRGFALHWPRDWKRHGATGAAIGGEVVVVAIDGVRDGVRERLIARRARRDRHGDRRGAVAATSSTHPATAGSRSVATAVETRRLRIQASKCSGAMV